MNNYSHDNLRLSYFTSIFLSKFCVLLEILFIYNGIRKGVSSRTDMSFAIELDSKGQYPKSI
jgi:hypothetical protein